MSDLDALPTASQPSVPTEGQSGGGSCSHTPGPWTAHQGWKDKWIDFDPVKYPDWCEVTGPDGGPYLSICGHFGLANARLIAAAPDMAEALSEALEYVERFADVRDGDYGAPEPNEAMQLASVLRSAILKATAQPAGGGEA